MIQPLRPHARRLLVAAALLAAAGGALLLAGRGDAANPLTLKTIAIDGNVADWDAVLANALQTTHDGDGSSANITANCALYSTDRDCPLGGGAGNDLYTFAWTYDATHVYVYIERYGSASNGVDFFFVADTDQDQRVKGTGDVVVHANWAGATGTVKIDAGAYVPVDALNGDPIVSPSGFVDGYDLPGGNGKLSDVTCGAADGAGVTTGADAGRKMEFRIPWCAFGIPAQKPFYWHVVSSNNASLATPLDNIGAPSGGLGTFIQRAVALFPDRSGAVLSPGAVTYDHTIRNDGNEADVFQFTATSSQGARLELLDELNAVIGRDDQGDGTWELPPQVSLAVGASKTLHLRITLPAGRTGQEVTRLTAVSVNDATVSATATDSSHVGSPAFVPETFSSWTQANVAAGFAETLVNGQLAADTFDLTADAGCLGDEVRLTLDSAGTQVVARDDGGDGTWDFVDPAWDSNGNLRPDRGVAGQSTASFWLWVKPPAGAPQGSCTLRLTASSPTTGASARADHALTVAPAVSFGPSYTRAAGTSLRAGVGASVFLPAVIRNAEGTPRSYALTQAFTQGSGATARVWSDPDGDGSPADGQVITTTGTIAAFGGTQHVVIEILTGTAPSGSALSLSTTATATSGGATATQTSEADVGYIATYADALLTQAASVFPPCATVHLHGSGLLANDTSSYALTWLTPTAATVREVTPWPTTLLGTADDAWTLGATAPTGSWTARLVDGPSTRDQNLSFTVELNASVTSLGTDKARYRPGDLVQVTGAFRDAGRVALEAGSLHYALDGAPLRTRTGVTVDAGATVSDPFTFTLPPGTPPGVRTLSAGWWLSCGASAFATRNVTFEVQPDPPVVTAPTTGARLADSTPTVTGTGVADASVTVTIGSTAYAPVTALADGTWSFTPPALSDGSWTVTATQSVAGVTSSSSAGVTFEVDTAPPDVPTIAAIASPTRANPVVAAVTAPGASSVAVYRDGALFATTPASVSGDVFTFDLALAEGTFLIQAAAADDLGNASALSAGQSVTVDRTPPAPPVIAGYTGPARDATIPVTATAAAGSTVTLFVDGALHSTLVEGPAGTFTGAVSPAVDGDYDLTATATDPAGNASVASAVVTLVVDRTPPAAPVVGTTVPLPPSQTNANPVPIAVTAEAGATVVLVVDGTPRPGLLPTFTAPDQYRFAVPLATGLHTVSATATDAAGNANAVPSNELSLDVDVTPPSKPAVQLTPPTTSPTNLQPVPFTVTAEAGATLAFTANGSPVAATLVSESGTTHAFTIVLAEGSYAVRATATDALGNVSVPSDAVSVTVDRTKPAMPTVTSPIPAATRVRLVTLTGLAEANSRVSATVTGAGLPPAPAPVVATGGSFTIDLDFTGSLDGDFQVVLRATDAAGNVSDPTPAATLRLDTTAPDAPVIQAIPESASPVVIHVSAEVGATVTLTLDDVARPELLPTSVIDTDYSFEVALPNGDHWVEATATDEAGNTSDPSLTQPFTINSTTPSTPTVAAASWVAATSFPVTVTADPDVTVVLFVGGVDSGLTPSVSGSTYTFTLSLGEGTWVLTSQARNGAGTWSAVSAAKVVNVDTTAPAAAPVITPALPPLANATSLPVSGTTEPYATVTVRVTGMPDVTTIASATGAWTVSAPLPAADGAYQVKVQAADRAGNLSPESAPVAVEVDRTGPALAPTIDPALPARTNAASIPVGGVTEAGATVTIEVAGMEPVTTTADGAGRYSVSVPLPAAEGGYAVTVSAKDAAGNAASGSTTVSVTVDTTPPAAAPSLALAPASPTSATSVTASGTAEANATVTIQVGTMTPVTTTADANGDYSVGVPLPEGEISQSVDVTVMATDEAGNPSPLSTPVAFVVDRVAPATPSLSLSPASPTSATSVTASGTAEANATVTVQVGTMTPVTTSAGANGAYSFSVPLPGGTISQSVDVTVKATDAAGNASLASAPVAFVVDRVAPATPSLTLSPASPTSAATLTASGTAEANATVTVQVGTMTPVTTPAGADGAYAVQVPLPGGTISQSVDVTVKATDAAGNASAASTPLAVVVDRVAPGTPSLSLSPASPTSATSVTASGTAEANATVTVQVGTMTPVTTPAGADGAYSVSVPLPGGAISQSVGVTVKASDAAGNESPTSSPVTFVVDRLGPAAAPTLDPLPTLTNAAGVTVSGTTEGNATVTVQVGALAPVTTTADGGGNYSVAAPLPASDGTYEVTVKATDVAGNDSPGSSPVTVQVDRTGPAAAPTVSPALPALTNVASVTVAGTTEPNAKVTVLVDGALAVTTSADGAGAYSVGAPLPPADGGYAVQVRATDLAGNASPLSTASTVVLDRTAPAAPEITAPEAGVSLAPGPIAITGTAEPGSTLRVVVDGGTPITTTADPTTGAFQVEVTLADGSHLATATATDPAGNTSTGTDRSFVVATPPAPPAEGGGGGCGCGAGGASAPEGLLLVAIGLLVFRRRRSA